MSSDTDALCMDCGLCCDGTLYGSVVVEAGESARLVRVGLRVIRGEDASSLAQPCTALRGCLCSVYADRPKACASYECLLRKRVGAGERSLEEARAKVAAIRALLATIREGFECPPTTSIWQKILSLEEPAPEDAAVVARNYASAIEAVGALLEAVREELEPRFAGGGAR